MGAAHVEPVTNLACRTALALRGVAHINFPVDLQEETTDARSKRNVAGYASEVYSRGARLPSDDDLGKAARILNAGRKVAILAGQGALLATDELEETAERLNAPVIKIILVKRQSRTTVPIQPAESVSSAPNRPRKRWKHATRCSWSVPRFPISNFL